nr:hypothetical protein [uncultured Roseovarius sp.]
MGRAYTKGAKLRAKKAKQGLPELAEVPKKQPNGRTRRTSDAGDPRKTVLDARCAIHGKTPSLKNRKALSGPYSGSDVGRCLAFRRNHDDAMRLWAVWQGYCQAHRTYRLRYVGQSEDPKGASIAMARERMETDQSHSVDLREPEQRDRDAVSNWMRWEGYLMRLDRQQMAAIKAARAVQEGVLWSDAAPTVAGRYLADAIVDLARVVEGK